MQPWEASPPSVSVTGNQPVELTPHAIRQRMEPLKPRLSDLIAGVSVFLILIPQGLAYAELAGLPSHLGLIAGTLPPIVAAFFVSSPYLQTGPTALTALLVLGALSHVAEAGSADYIMLASLLALLVGIARIVFGLLRLGIMAYFVSQPVLTGFTTGAAILIAGTQVPAIFGVSVSRLSADGQSTRSVMSRALEALTSFDEWSAATIFLGFLTLALTLGLRKLHTLFPSVLVAVAVSWILAAIFDMDVARIGDLPSSLPHFSLDLPYDRTGSLLLPALVIALVGFVEPASIARTYATAKREKWSANQEFLSQGVANIAAASIGAFPVGGSFGRSSLNERAGARTRWSGAITGVTMLAFLPFVGLLGTIPRAALGAVVVSAAISLIRLDRIAAMWEWSKPQSATAVATLVATLALDPRIDQAILLGIGFSIAVHLWREIQVFVEIQRIDERTLMITPYGVMWFGSVNRIIENILSSVADHDEVSRLVINLEGVGRLDLTAAGDLADFANEQRASGLEVEFAEIPPHAKRLFESLLRTPES